MDKELIRAIYAQWKAAKACAEEECRKRNLSNLASKYRMCDMFKGDETLEQIAELYKSTRGGEFCLRYHFPNIETLRMFKKDKPERFGIYIDAGDVDIIEPSEKVVVVGNTNARITCSETKRYQIAALQGATAIINAGGWSVVAAECEKGATVIKNAKDRAIIL